jgi:hypothetical protein
MVHRQIEWMDGYAQIGYYFAYLESAGKIKRYAVSVKYRSKSGLFSFLINNKYWLAGL